MVRADPCGEVLSEITSAQLRGVAINGSSGKKPDFAYYVPVAVLYPGDIHDLAQPDHPGHFFETPQFLEADDAGALLERAGRHGGRGHNKDIDGQMSEEIKIPDYAFETPGVCDFVKIGDDGGGAVGQKCVGIRPRKEVKPLEMQVAVYQTGGHVQSGKIYDLSCRYGAKRKDPAVFDRKIPSFDPLSKRIDYCSVL